MKILTLILLLFLLTGCEDKERPTYSTMQEKFFKTLCMDGVAYWVHTSPHNVWFAPRYDANTGKVVTCNGVGYVYAIKHTAKPEIR